MSHLSLTGSGNAGRQILFSENFSSGTFDPAKWSLGATPVIEDGKGVVNKDGSVIGNFQMVPTVNANHELTFDLRANFSNGGLSGGQIWLRNHETEIGISLTAAGDALSGVTIFFARTGGTDVIGFTNSNEFTRYGPHDYGFRVMARMDGNIYHFAIGSLVKGPYTDSGHVVANCTHYFLQGDCYRVAYDNIEIAAL